MKLLMEVTVNFKQVNGFACKINETMQISAIKSIESMLKNAIQIT